MRESRFKFPKTDIEEQIDLKRILHRKNKVYYSVVNHDYYIAYDISAGTANLHKCYIEKHSKVDLAEDLTKLPDELLEFVLFNANIFR